MQIWKKNFIVTFLLFVLIINAGTFFLVAAVHRNEFQKETDSAVMEAHNIGTAAAALSGFEAGAGRTAQMGIKYRENGTYIQIREQDTEAGREVINMLPFQVEYTGEKRVWKQKIEGRCFLGIENSVYDNGIKLYILSLRDITRLCRNQNSRIWGSALAALLLSDGIGMFLYTTMRRIYRPVNNIAHELRTPLTNIQGYAQYLKAGKLNPEDIFFAGQQIEQDARNLRDIVDKLLIMGSVREGEIKTESVSSDELLTELKKRYPTVRMNCRTERITGDKTLLLCLMDNLLSNAVRAGTQAELTLEKHKIIVKNDGPPIDGRKLAALNRDIRLAKNEVEGNGFGVSLCHEIARLHKARLKFESDDRSGTVVTMYCSGALKR
ncbi:HAMP domain-containing histidine kinase [Ruminococcus sp. OA3]|uniref:sensor histidine kinase n=1 Tax=Ruminococcus sp. OA3 TaxID=2914164 RepID=UPI001F06903C|nr:HAMP domain-containing sensor histidine kinase [Ruminococcus sp. OA3]MCH1981022.1 HAMP domain-containing histidine kinase [Ruminococcus sp. OA3]